MVFANLPPMMYTSRPKTKQARVYRTSLWKGLGTLLAGPLILKKGKVQYRHRFSVNGLPITSTLITKNSLFHHTMDLVHSLQI